MQVHNDRKRYDSVIAPLQVAALSTARTKILEMLIYSLSASIDCHSLSSLMTLPIKMTATVSNALMGAMGSVQ